MSAEGKPRTIRAALVTGASGFVGAHLVKRLGAAGIRVRAMVRDPARAARLRDSGAEMVMGDITARATIAAALAGVDTVFHCAALVTGDARPRSEFESVNVLGTGHLVDACLRQPTIERVVHVSTVGVYGYVRRGEVVCEQRPPRPEGHYGLTKLEAERVALAAHAAGLPVVIARPMWVYGSDSPGVVRLFRLIARRRMVLIGGARNAIQPVTVEDLVRGLLCCASASGVGGEVFNFAGPTPITTAQLCRDIANALGVPPPRWNVPLGAARIAARICESCYPRALGKPLINLEKISFFANEHAYSIAKAEERLGWRPETTFEAGASQVARELRERGLLA